MQARTTRGRRNRGSSLLVSLVVLTALLGLGSLTALSVQGSQSAVGRDRFKQMALYAAESGAAAAMDFLRDNFDQANHWTNYVSANNANPVSPTAIAGNGALPSSSANVLGGTESWYQVSFLNNPTDPGFAAGTDTDARLIIVAVGHGPDGATTTIHWEIQASVILPSQANNTVEACGSYAQKNISELGAANACQSNVSNTEYVVYTPN